LFRKGHEAIEHFYTTGKVEVAARIDCASVLNMGSAIWYHPSVSLITLIALYEGQGGLPGPIDWNQLEPLQVAPWNNDTKGSSQRRHARFTHKTEGRKHKRGGSTQGLHISGKAK
jgi:hypothetical protein